MSQRSTSLKKITATLWAIIDEIDDDDEDILEITIDISNASNQDMWDIHGDVKAMDGTHGTSRQVPSRIEAKEDDNLTFWIPATTGAWLFKLDYNTDSGHETIELGPFADDLRIAATERPKRVVESVVTTDVSERMDVASNDDPLAMAFGTALDGFGDGLEAGSELMNEATSEDPMQAAFAGGILASKQAPSIPEPANEIVSGPPVGVPTGPPTGPPAEAPTGPPSGPPIGPPSEAPTGPPSGPPTGPPVEAPTGPPSGPPAVTQSSAPPGPPPGRSSGGPPGPPPS